MARVCIQFRDVTTRFVWKIAYRNATIYIRVSSKRKNAESVWKIVDPRYATVELHAIPSDNVLTRTDMCADVSNIFNILSVNF